MGKCLHTFMGESHGKSIALVTAYLGYSSVHSSLYPFKFDLEWFIVKNRQTFHFQIYSNNMSS